MDTLTELTQIIDRARYDDEGRMINPIVAAQRVIDYLKSEMLLEAGQVLKAA